MKSSAHPVVLQPRLLDQAQSLEFQTVLHRALQAAPAVIVDCIWLQAIDPAGVAVLKQALHQATRLGKSIAVRGASAALSAMLEQEQVCLRNRNLGAWQPHCHREFDDFLQERSQWHKAATAADGEIVFPQFGRSTSKIA